MRFLTCLLVLSLFVPLAGAQSYTGSIIGTVKDSSGAVIPNATVTLLNAATNARSETRSGATGNFAALQLPPGTYHLEVSAAGFKKFVREGIVLQVQQTANLEVILPVGEVTDSVVVTGEAPLLESTTSSVGKVVDNRRIVNLPLNTRNVYSLIFLTPGVTGTVGINYDDMRYSVNGGRQRMLDTLVDGVAASHPTVNGAGGVSVFPSVDAIEEFKVMGANPPAEFGRSQGSVLNVAFKSGANAWHGSAYEFLRNSVLDANNFFSNRRGQPLGSFKRSQFGGVLSGPIRKDKTFFLVDYEGLRERSLSTTTFTVPTELERRGDFSRTLAQNGQLIQVFNPLSTRPSGSGSIRDAFAGNLVPASMFDPVATNVLKYYPRPNAVGNAVTNQNNYQLSGARQLNLDQFDVRVDHNLSDKQRFFGRFSRRAIEDAPPAFFPADLAIAEGRVIQRNTPYGAVADYTHTLSPTTILSVRMGFARTLFEFANQGLGFVPSSLGLPKEIDTAVDRQMFPRFGADYVGLGGNDHRRSGFNTYTLNASVSKVRGVHTMKTGFEGRLIRVNVWEARDAGSFNFSRSFTQGPDPTRASSTAGNSLASLLLGTGSGGNLYQAWKNVAAQSIYYAGYFQDDWRITSKLTLNLGVRYDLDTPRTERFNRVNFFDPLAASPLAKQVSQFPNLQGGLVFVGVNGRDRHQYEMDKNNLAPRIGLAYQLDRKTAIRMGWGNLYGLSAQAAQGTVGPYGFRVENTWVTSLDNGLTPFNLLKNPYPQGFRAPPGAADGLITGAGGPIQGVLRETPTPYSMQWNVTVQRELPGQVLLEAGYVGTRGLQLNRSTEGGFDLNQLTTDRMALGNRLNDQVPNPFFGIVNNGVL
ncbi:MAG: TonB-dependent receptor, partial [Candidatus Solibacter usitatus]|nr:TonB-dependent receptor [Candidatus Solibacter usitatus]